MNLRELEALGMTLQMSVMFGEMDEQSAVDDLHRQLVYAKVIDEVSK